jgi:hypothetical protein
MPRNFGIQVNDARFESFINSADKLQRMQLRVGILSGKPKYDPGHVGAKSRQADTMDRFAAINSTDRVTSMISAYRAKKKKAPGFKRRARKKRVDVAKVAAVVGLEVGGSFLKGGPKASRPKLPRLWREANERQGNFLQKQSAVAMEYCLEGRSAKGPIVRFGERLRMAYVAAVIREGHVDTRRLINTIAWEITDLQREKFLRRQLTAMNKAKRLQREARKAAKAAK